MVVHSAILGLQRFLLVLNVFFYFCTWGATTTNSKIAWTPQTFHLTRNDFLHKLSTKVIRENQTIVLEDLNVSGMMKMSLFSHPLRKLSRAISDLGWYKFRTVLEAKSEMYGRDFRVIDRWTPTSQTCSTITL